MSRIKWAHMADLDWDRPNKVIAAELGVSAVWVRRKRLELGQIAAPRVCSEIYRDVDWSLSDQQIAADLGVAARNVWRHRNFGHWRPK